MAVTPFSERGIILPPFGEVRYSLPPQRAAELRGKLYYFGNGVALVPRHPRESDGFGMEEEVFHALALEEKGLLVGADLPNEKYKEPRMKGTGGSDMWGFTIREDGLYVWDRTYEIKSGKHLDVQETLGRQRSLVERFSQKPADMLFFLQSTYPRRLPFPKDVWISTPGNMTVIFVGVDEIPNEPMVDQKGRFPNIFYQQYKSKGNVVPAAA